MIFVKSTFFMESGITIETLVILFVYLKAINAFKGRKRPFRPSHNVRLSKFLQCEEKKAKNHVQLNKFFLQIFCSFFWFFKKPSKNYLFFGILVVILYIPPPKSLCHTAVKNTKNQ